jgi:hypothetical protein
VIPWRFIVKEFPPGGVVVWFTLMFALFSAPDRNHCLDFLAHVLERGNSKQVEAEDVGSESQRKRG